MLNALFINILSMSTIASIVFLLILLARKLMKNKVSFEKCSLLWIMFIIVLLIPLNFESKLSIKNYIDSDEKFALNRTSNYVSDETTRNYDSAYVNVDNRKLDIITIGSLTWFIIMLLLILKDIFVYKTCINKNEFSEIPKDILDVFEECKKELNIKGNIKLAMQNKIKTPSLYGIFNTKILLTNEILNFSRIELKCIFMHELYHFKNYHNVYYLIFSTIEKIHWFNPVIRIAFELLKQDLEILTDSNVLKSNIKRNEYCKTILKVEKLCSLSSLKMPTICSGKDEIERRIKEMKNMKTYTKVSIIILGIAILSISLITVSLASDKVQDKNVINNEIFETLEDEKVEFILPLENAVVSAKFGTRVHPITNEETFHSGIDFVAEEGIKVRAAAEGIVEVATFDTQKGNYVEIRHNDGSISSYQHGSEILVEVGDKVAAGDKIMLVGKTGMATGPHLHFEVRNENGEYMDVNMLCE